MLRRDPITALTSILEEKQDNTYTFRIPNRSLCRMLFALGNCLIVSLPSVSGFENFQKYYRVSNEFVDDFASTRLLVKK